MGVRTRLRSFCVLVAGVMVVALVAPPGWARPCADCEQPELPGPGGPNCPTISATQEPSLTTVSPRVNGTVQGSTGTWSSNAKTMLVIWYVGASSVTTAQTFPDTTRRTVSYTPKAADVGKPVRLYVRAIGTDPACIKGEYSEESSPVAHGPAPAYNLPASIIGNPQVGQTLQSYPGTWNMPVDSFDLVWRWETGEHRGTGPSYALTAADLGKRIRLDVVAQRAGHHQGSSSFTTAGAVVSGPAPTASVAPSVSGTRRVGATLTVATGTWSPTPGSYTYQWSRGSTTIPGATGASYQLTAADRDQVVTVRVTAHRPGHASGSVVASAGSIAAAAALTVVTAPTVSGTLAPGQQLTASDGVWSPAATTTARQWLRDGQPIPGATGPTYDVTAADVGVTVGLRVTASRPGHADGVTTVSAGVVAQGPALRLLSLPEVRGSAVFGEWLSVGMGVWSPVQSDLRVQWLRDGQPIAGATSHSYRPVVADVGRVLSARVTAMSDGYADGVATVRVGKVAAAEPAKWKGKKPGLKGRDKVQKKVRVALGPKKLRNRASAPGARITYQWLRNGKVIKKGAVKRAYKIKKVDRGKKLRARITFTRPGHRPLVVTTKVVKVRNKGRVIR